jgi:leader peptidase (prepilin peptidase)/N-methyltransferase
LNDSLFLIGSAFVLAVAPFLGSFVATLAVRVLDVRSIILGRSHCPHCLHRLALADLVPILSWLWSLGRCRYCRSPVGIFYPGAEAAAMAIAVVSVVVFPGIDALISCGLGWTLLTLALIDLRHHILPDALTLPLAAAGLGTVWPRGGAALLDHALGSAAGLLIFLAISYIYQRLRDREGLGIGDAKLLAAGGAWVAWQGLASVVLIASAVALAVTIIQATRGGVRIQATTRIPFGLYLGPAIWLVWLVGPINLG